MNMSIVINSSDKTVEWAQHTIQRADQLINTIVAIGGIAIAVLIAFILAVLTIGYFVGSWHFQHKRMFKGLEKWEGFLAKGEAEAVNITQRLGLPLFVDLKMENIKSMVKEWIQETEKSTSVSEIDRFVGFLKFLVNMKPEVFLMLGHYYRFMGDEFQAGNQSGSAKDYYETAIRRYREAATAAEHSSDSLVQEAASYHGIAVSYERLGRFEDSLAASNAAIEKNQGKELRFEPFDTRGIALHVLGKYDQAIQAFETANNLKPNYPRILYNTACTYAKWGEIEVASRAGHFEKALTCLEHAVIDPEAKKRALADPDFLFLKSDVSYGGRFLALVT